MNIIHLSYARCQEQYDPVAWLNHINFFTGILDSMKERATVKSIHCISYEGVLQRQGVEYHFLNLTKWEGIFPFRINKYIKDLHPDVVIVHGLVFPWQLLLLRFMLNNQVKIVVQHHAEKPLRFHKKFLQKIADRYIQAFFFASKDLATPWIKAGQLKSTSKVHEVMEVSSIFYPIEELQKATPDYATTYIWVGRLDANKDAFTLIRAFKEFVAINPEVKLYIIFRGNMLLRETKQLLFEGGPTDQITLLEDVNHHELLQWYNQAAFVISTSHYEGSGTAVCEAMSCGCIPILTNIPSFRMMTNHGMVGFLFEPGNSTELKNILIKSTQVNVMEEQKRVLYQYESTLSFNAISDKMLHVINKLK
jgi:glycosyltransferase involved in cell wall biosynthesis